MGQIISAQAQNTLPAIVKDPKIVGPVMKSVWQAYTATAEKYNEPGRFTAIIGYEWTSVPGGNNLHRNVLFRDNKDKADQILPFSSLQSEDPEKLWDFLAKYEAKTGGRVLAIPHNGNLSNGRMFALTDFKGNPMTADYAKRRAHWNLCTKLCRPREVAKLTLQYRPTTSSRISESRDGSVGILRWKGNPKRPQCAPICSFAALCSTDWHWNKNSARTRSRSE
jgi:hypothetical protein